MCPDLYEPNDGFSAAWDVGWGAHVESYLCSAQDVDYFRADIGTRRFNGFDIALSNLPADYNLQVFDMAETLIASSTRVGLASESVAVQEQSVYVRVLGADGAHHATQPYHLDVIPVTLPSTTPTSTLVPTPTTVQRWHLYLPLVVRSEARR
jgi:bacillolysin/thermolysin